MNTIDILLSVIMHYLCHGENIPWYVVVWGGAILTAGLS